MGDITCSSYSFNHCDFIYEGQVYSIGSNYVLQEQEAQLWRNSWNNKTGELYCSKKMFVLWYSHTSWKDTDHTDYSSGAWPRGSNFVSSSDGYENYFSCNFFFWHFFFYSARRKQKANQQSATKLVETVSNRTHWQRHINCLQRKLDQKVRFRDTPPSSTLINVVPLSTRLVENSKTRHCLGGAGEGAICAPSLKSTLKDKSVSTILTPIVCMKKLCMKCNDDFW